MLAAALKRSKLSVRKAAPRADISEGRWRQIVNGYQSIGKGVYAPVSAPPETLARMAAVLDLTPGDLRKAGRDDAATELEDLPHSTTPATGPTEPDEADEAEIMGLPGLTDDERRFFVEQLRATKARARLQSQQRTDGETRQAR